MERKDKMFKREIIISSQFVGFHSWIDAPEEVAFLRNVHRHLFHIRVGYVVTHRDRQLEFFMEKDKLERELIWISKLNRSCEGYADHILNSNQLAEWAEVFEDGENGARVERVQK